MARATWLSMAHMPFSLMGPGMFGARSFRLTNSTNGRMTWRRSLGICGHWRRSEVLASRHSRRNPHHGRDGGRDLGGVGAVSTRRAANRDHRGYFGVAIYHGKSSVNYGSLFRTAQIQGAAFLASIGPRYRPQCSDVLKSWRHLPTFVFPTSMRSWPRGPMTASWSP